MIVQIRFDVTGSNQPQLEQAATDVLSELVESPEFWRTAIEVHQAESGWIGHVTVRRKRTRPDDWDEF